jgi:hypothetical protein
MEKKKFCINILIHADDRPNIWRKKEDRQSRGERERERARERRR